MNQKIIYPYIPEWREINYVNASNFYMAWAREFARLHSLDKVMPGAAVLVADSIMTIGIGANGSDYHQSHDCQRIILGSKTGEGYELCEGCHPKNHSEAKAIQHAISNGYDPEGTDLYLWGHWWCCKPCWTAMIGAGINQVFLLEGSEILFNKEHPDNIVGRQFK